MDGENPNVALDLIVDRVDLVDQGANTEAYIKLFKRKETKSMEYEEILKEMKDEHAAVVIAKMADAETKSTDTEEELTKALDEISTLKAKIAELEKPAEEPKEESMEDVLKNLDPSVQKMFKSMTAQKEAAEEIAKSLAEEKENEEAIAKARKFKSLPVEEELLITVVKSASKEVLEVLEKASAALDTGEIFEEVGKATKQETDDAWSMIEKKAEEIAKRDSVTKQKAVGQAIKECPELYRDYLKGGVR